MESKDPIPAASARFLAICATAPYDTFDEFLEASQGHGLEEFLAVARPMIERLRAELLLADQKAVMLAWADLRTAFDRQLKAAEEAHREGRASEQKSLNKFYATLTELKRAVKRHSGTPGHRPMKDPERARNIYRMRTTGKSFFTIARKHKIKAKNAAQIYFRYLQRSQDVLYQSWLRLFSRPPK